MNEIVARLQEFERDGLTRRLRMISGPQGPRVLLDGKPVLVLCSNNYLGLADHPRVREAAAEAAMRWGVGAGASRLVSGTMTIHRRLEQRLAAFVGTEECVLFGSGYLANLGVIGALARRGDTVFSDERNHASIVDACRLSHADVVVYRHRDVEHLDWLARRSGKRAREGHRLIVTDAVFSMDGDVAPLVELAELAELHDARMVVDEAHAIGALGPGGRGVVAQAGLESEVDVIVGTLGKALGSYGAFACASAEMVQYLINAARPLIFSTAPAPPAVAASLSALALLTERPHRVRRLASNARELRRTLRSEGFPVAEDEMHIVPLIAGEEHVAMRLCEQAIERGVFAQAIRPPAVPAGSSRLRLVAMASHTSAELARAARILGEVARALGLDPAAMAAPSELELTSSERDDLAAPAWAQAWGLQSRPSGRPFDAGAQEIALHAGAQAMEEVALHAGMHAMVGVGAQEQAPDAGAQDATLGVSTEEMAFYVELDVGLPQPPDASLDPGRSRRSSEEAGDRIGAPSAPFDREREDAIARAA